MSFQSITVVGNLGSDAKLQFNANGMPYVRFSLATNRKIRQDDGSLAEITTWFNACKTGPIAETLSPYLVKGARVCVLGKLVADKITGHPKVFETKDGKYDSSFEIMASEIILLNKPAQKQAQYDDDFDDDFDDDLF